MAARESRSKTLHYKRADVIGADVPPLSDLLLQAFARESRPLRRAERRAEESGNVRLVNRPYQLNQMICGCFLDFTEGYHQPTIKLSAEEIELAIDQIPPRDQEQFIEGMLFFGVQRHHVILLQSKGLRSAEFEQHLNWLLREQTVLPSESHVVLRDEPTRAARDKLSGVSSVMLRAPVSIEVFQSPAHAGTRESVIGAATRHLRSVLHTHGTFFEHLSADEALKFEDVEISLEIRRRRQRRGKSLIDELANALRHTDEDVFELRTKSGKVLKSGELKLRVSKSVATRNGMPLLADVAQKMHDWLESLVEDRQVSEV